MLVLAVLAAAALTGSALAPRLGASAVAGTVLALAVAAPAVALLLAWPGRRPSGVRTLCPRCLLAHADDFSDLDALPALVTAEIARVHGLEHP